MPNLTYKCILAIFAHPSDADASAGGIIAKLATQGSKVIYAVVTNGDKGSDLPNISSEELADIRKNEQIVAAQSLGVLEVNFLNYPDGEVYNSTPLRRDLVKFIRLYRPDLVITHDPTSRFVDGNRINHPDHCAVGDAVLDAVFPMARDRLYFSEFEEQGLLPHKVLSIFLARTHQPNEQIDISDVIDLKLNALSHHASQYPSDEKIAAMKKKIKERDKISALETPFEYAEAFRYVFCRP